MGLPGQGRPEASRPWEETDRLIMLAKNWECLDEAQIWAATDRLIAKAKELESVVIHIQPPREFGGFVSDAGANSASISVPRIKSKQRVAKADSSKSVYWSTETDPSPVRRGTQPNGGITMRTTWSEQQPGLIDSCSKPNAERSHGTLNSGHHMRKVNNINKNDDAQRLLVSPYFCKASKFSKDQATSKRPPPGTISSIPFPPLTSSFFGIVQEQVAHEPFWLLVAITFLIKTKGAQAIPTFWKVKKAYPSPAHLANPAIKEELVGMIRHLGFSTVRLGFLQKYARGFLKNPPRAGVRHKIKKSSKPNRPREHHEAGEEDSPGFDVQSLGSEEEGAWEIGHMTSGKYAIDSWRIFCRDELLGEAEDWNGKGRGPEFQPEWMRVMPDDKELRAYLRWMWMREGWEWDPNTGQRTVLREEMQRAVNEGRVGYDDAGGLRIVKPAVR